MGIMHASPVGRAITQAFESCLKQVAGGYTTYKCPAGVLTIGWGTTNSDVVFAPGEVWSKQKCDQIFADSLAAKYEPAILKRFPNIVFTQNQFDALVGITYNCGPGCLDGSIGRAIRSGDFATVPKYMARWNKANGKTLAGLVRRRKAEGELWSGNVEAALRTAQTTAPGTTARTRETPKPTTRELARETPKTTAALAADGAITGGTAVNHDGAAPTAGTTGAVIVGGVLVGLALAVVAAVLWKRLSEEWA